MPRPPRAVQSYLAIALLALLAVGLPLARGGVDAPTLVVEVLLATAAAALAVWHLPEVPAAALLLCVPLLLQLAQLVPLPATLHGVSPVASRVFEVSLQPLGLYPGPRPLSLDPLSSAGRLAEGIACLAVFLAAWTVSGSRQRLHYLCGAVGLSGVVVAVVVLGAAVFGLGPVFEPRFPFVNPNHLAAFTNLTALVCLGLTLHGHGPERLLWLVGAVVVAAVGVLSLSRAGLGALLFGATLFAALLLRREGRDRLGRATALGVVALAVCAAIGLSAYVASDSLLAEVRSVPRALEESKPLLWRAGLGLLRESPWVGIGRGTFGQVFAAYKADALAVTYTHVENEWLQAFIDLGIPCGLLVLVVLAWVWLRAASERLGALQVGLLAGTAAVAIHDLADFSLEIPGVAVPFFACLGAASGVGRTVRFRRGVLSGGIVLAGLLALTGAGLNTATLRRAVDRPGKMAAEVVAAARWDARWHPADYVPHAAAGAALAAAERCSEAQPWLDRAMLLNPTDPTAHRATAACLWARGQRVAASIEFRLAMAYGDAGALWDAIPRYPALADLLRAVPDTPDYLYQLGGALSGTRPADAAEVLQHLLDESLDPRALLPLARVRLALRQPEQSLELASRIQAASPGEAQGYLVAYASLEALGRPAEAEQALFRGTRALPGNAELLTALWARALQARHYSEAKRYAEEIVPRSAGETTTRELLAARALAGQGRLPEAIERARWAAASSPDSAEPLLELAGMLAGIRRFEEAIDVLERAAGLPGADLARCRAMLADVRRAAAQREAERMLPAEPTRDGASPDTQAE